MFAEFMFGAMVKLRRFQQGFGGNTTRVEAGSTECIFSVQVFPLVNAGDIHAELAGTNRSDITGWPGTDYDDVKTSAQGDLHLQQHATGIFERLLQAYKKLYGFAAVDDSVIIS